jgi:hypothetical protein
LIKLEQQIVAWGLFHKRIATRRIAELQIAERVLAVAMRFHGNDQCERSAILQVAILL